MFSLLVILGVYENTRIEQKAKRHPDKYGVCVFCHELTPHKQMDTNIMACDDCILKLEAKGFSVEDIKRMAEERKEANVGNN